MPRPTSFGKDTGLQIRMATTMLLLGAVYVALGAVLFLFLGNAVPMIIILGGLAALQFFTSDKLALAAMGARVEYSGLQPDPGSSVHITFCPSSDSDVTFALQARVVRATDSGGFAVRFEAADARLKRQLAELAERIAELPSL